MYTSTQYFFEFRNGQFLCFPVAINKNNCFVIANFRITFPGNNFVHSFFYIARGVMLIQYAYCQETFQQCPAPIAVGPKRTGKATAVKVFLYLVGNETKQPCAEFDRGRGY